MSLGLFTYPQVRVRRKSRFGPLDEDRAFCRALEAARGIPRVLPVIWAGKLLGWASGVSPFTPRVFATRSTLRPPVLDLRSPGAPGYRCSVGDTGYDGIISKLTSTTFRNYLTEYAKAHTTAPGGGVTNSWHDLWPVCGSPRDGTYTGAAFTARSITTADPGALALGPAASPELRRLASFAMFSTGGTPTLLFHDRVLTYEACTFNASANQAMTNGTAASRYISSGTQGLLCSITCQTATGATGSNLTQFRYTDQDGNTLQSMPTTITISFFISIAAPTATLGARVHVPVGALGTATWGPFIPLAAGDTGMRLVNDWTTSAANTGTSCIALLFPYALVPTYTAGTTFMEDTMLQVMRYANVTDDAAISALGFFPASTATTLNGFSRIAQG